MEKMMQMDETMEESLWNETFMGIREESEPMNPEAEDTGEPRSEETTGFLKDDRGIGVIEMVLILVVLVGLVLIFKNQLTAIVGDVFDKVNATINRL